MIAILIKVNYPPASWGASGARILALSSLEFALQRLETLLATPPAIHPASKLTGILANFYKSQEWRRRKSREEFASLLPKVRAEERLSTYSIHRKRDDPTTFLIDNKDFEDFRHSFFS